MGWTDTTTQLQSITGKWAWGENVAELAQKEMDRWANFEEVWHSLENQRADCPGAYTTQLPLAVYWDDFFLLVDALYLSISFVIDIVSILV